MKFERFRFSASAIASIFPIRSSGRLIEICVMPLARADSRDFHIFFIKDAQTLNITVSLTFAFKKASLRLLQPEH